MRRPILVAAGVLVTLVAGARANAATLRVPSEYSSIMGAINAAVAGDTVLVAPGVYTNCDEAPCTATVAELSEGLTLKSEGGPDVTQLELVPGGPSTGLLVVDARLIGAGGARIEGFEITSHVSNSRGMVSFGSQNVTVQHCRFVDIATSHNSGAGLGQNGGSLEVLECEFIRCTAVQTGGGIMAIGSGSSQTVVRDCLFQECGPTAFVAGGGGDIQVTGCEFRNNFGEQPAALLLFGTYRATVLQNTFVENVSTQSLGGALLVNDVAFACEVRGNLFVRNRATYPGGGGGGMVIGERGVYAENTFIGNEGDEGAAILDAHNGEGVVMERNIIALSVGGPAFVSGYGERPGDCNLFWANTEGDFQNYGSGPNDLFVDPQFCDVPTDDYTVRSSSPCAEENSPVCGQIGALGEGCGTVGVEPVSWGKLKAFHRVEDSGR